MRAFGTLAEEHCGALVVCVLHRVGGQAGFAHPGFTRDQGDPQPAFGRRLLAKFAKQSQLGVAPREAEQSAGGVLRQASRHGYA